MLEHGNAIRREIDCSALRSAVGEQVTHGAMQIDVLRRGVVVDDDEHGPLRIRALADFHAIRRAGEDGRDAALPDEIGGEFFDERIIEPCADVGDGALFLRSA